MIEETKVAGRTAWVARPEEAALGAVVAGASGAIVRRAGAVVVCHGGGGLGPHDRGVIERLAALGYVAIAPDLFGEPPSRELVIGLVTQPARLRERVGAAIEHIRVDGNVAVVGHCFGGTAALEAARSGLDIACAVSFHGGLKTSEAATRITARILACCGAADPHCPPEQRAAFEAEMTSAGADWQLHVYGGTLHGFTMRGSEKIPGCAYNERADRRSWAAMIELLDETIGT